MGEGVDGTTGEAGTCTAVPGGGSDDVSAGCTTGGCQSGLSATSASMSGDGQSVTISGGNGDYVFHNDGEGNYSLVSPADPTATLTEAENHGTVTFQAGGRTLTFHGFNSGLPGQLQATASGNAPSFNYVYAGVELTSILRSDGRERYLLDYAGGELATLTHQLGDGSTWTNVDQIAYTRYATDSYYGLTGDIMSLVTSTWDAATGAWVRQKAKHYAYDQGAGQLRHVFDDRRYQNLLAATGKTDLGDFEQADDATVANYAAQSYTYASGKVAAQQLDGGQRVYTLAYQTNDSAEYSDGHNHWKFKTTETLRDDQNNLVHTKIVYLNYLGNLILSDLTTADGKRWLELKQYDEDGLVVLHAQPSALTGYSQGEVELTPVYRADSGLVRLYEYYDATTATESSAGGVQYSLHYERLRRGANTSSDVTLKEVAYWKHTAAGGETTYPVASVTEHIDDTRTATTTYTYTWESGASQPACRVTHLPAISADQNGPGGTTGATREDYFDAVGRVAWQKNERGRVTYRDYDPTTGAVVRIIEDCDADALDLAGIVPPTGLTVPDDGLHLITDITLDAQGRATETLGPEHDAVDDQNQTIAVRTAQWILYDDAGRRTVRSQGYTVLGTPETTVVVNPVSITLTDAYGRTIDEIRAVATVTDRAPVASDTFIDQTAWRRWTRSEYDDAHGLLAATRVYHSIPASGLGGEGVDLNFARAEVGYDWAGRQNRTKGSDGTITRVTFDDRGRQLCTYIGTCDAGATDTDPTGAEAEGNNMRLVTSREYDSGQGGGLNSLTRVVQYVDDTGTLDRTTRYQYDWRGRQTVMLGEEGVCQVQVYDNLDRAVRTQRRDGSPDGLLLAQSETSFDDLGRVYRNRKYDVDPVTGELGNALVDNTWYNAAGQVIKQQPSGSNAFTKTVYDTLGRAIARYSGYDPAGIEDHAGAATVDDDLVFEQMENEFDTAGNVTRTLSLQRYHDASGTQLGGLVPQGDPNANSRPRYEGFWYDGFGRQVASANYGTATLDRSTQTTVPTCSDTVLVTSTGYDDADQAFQTIDPAGREDRREFDHAGRLVRTIQNYVANGTAADENVTVETAYSLDGQILMLRAVNSATGDQVTRYVYGTAVGEDTPAIYRNDLLRAVIYPDSTDPVDLQTGVYDHVENWYNRQGELICMKDQNGTVHEYHFDGLGRQISDRVTTVGAGIDTAVLRIDRRYNRLGLLESVTSYAEPEGETIVNAVLRVYNGLDMLVQESQEHQGEVNDNTLSVAYAFDDSASDGLFAKGLRLTSITYPNGRVVNYSYGTAGSSADVLNRLDAILDNDGTTALAQYGYVGLQQIHGVNYPEPGIAYDLAHKDAADQYDRIDAFGRVTDVLWKTSSSDLVHLKHGYDRSGSRLYRQDVAAGVSNLDELCAYDGMNQLVSMQRGHLDLTSPSAPVLSSPGLSQSWDLDATGNWSGVVTDGETQTRMHNSANEVLSASGWTATSFDQAGNMVVLPCPASPQSGFHCAYDAWNRLTMVVEAASGQTAAQYRYDGENRRIMKSVHDAEGELSEVRRYCLSRQNQMLEERLVSPTLNCRSLIPASQNVWGLRYIDDLVLRDRDTDGDGVLDERFYALQDANWNVAAVASTSGAVQERYTYTAYGQCEVRNADFSVKAGGTAYDWTALYTGRGHDSETGLYYYRARYYDAGLGRFTGRDPIEFLAGEWSLYLYVHNCPTTLLDPSGLKLEPEPLPNPGAPCYRTATRTEFFRAQFSRMGDCPGPNLEDAYFRASPLDGYPSRTISKVTNNCVFPCGCSVPEENMEVVGLRFEQSSIDDFFWWRRLFGPRPAIGILRIQPGPNQPQHGGPCTLHVKIAWRVTEMKGKGKCMLPAESQNQ